MARSESTPLKLAAHDPPAEELFWGAAHLGPSLTICVSVLFYITFGTTMSIGNKEMTNEIPLPCFVTVRMAHAHAFAQEQAHAHAHACTRTHARARMHAHAKQARTQARASTYTHKQRADVQSF